MAGVLRAPRVLFAFGVHLLRQVPGARFAAPLMPWVARLLVLAAIVLVIAWGFEASPQRLALAELAAGGLGR
jgi:hypothetical protein